MKCIIIEDEAKTSEGLVYILNKYCPEVEVEGIAESYEGGLRLIRSLQPALLFIDIQLNSIEGTGLDLVQTLSPKSCAVIFISGYKEFAVNAFRLRAVDYLLKPLLINQVVEAVDNAKKFLSLSEAQPSNIFHIPTQNGFVVVRQSEIIHCEADGAYTIFYVKDLSEKIISSVNIGQIEKKLGPDFLRVHKSHIINKHYVMSYTKGDNTTIKMADQFEVPVPKNQKNAFYEWLK